MKTLTILALATFSVAAQAEPIHCSFTEPFISVEVDAAKNVVVERTPDTIRLLKIRELSQKDGTTKVVFGDEKSEVTYVRDNQGSDGMSDFRYPYSSELRRADIPGVLFGGCYTASEPPVEEIIEE